MDKSQATLPTPRGRNTSFANEASGIQLGNGDWHGEVTARIARSLSDARSDAAAAPRGAAADPPHLPRRSSARRRR